MRRGKVSPKTSKRSESTSLGSISNSSGAFSRINLRKEVIVSTPKNIQLFPDVYRCYGRTTITELMTPGSASAARTFALNSPMFNFGPQINWAGSYAANVPSGSIYLLAANTTTGANAPYNYCLTDSVDVNINLSNLATVPTQVVLVPSLSPSLSGMPFQTVCEQRYAVSTLLPSAQTSGPTRLQARISIADLVGVPRSEVLANLQYRQQRNQVPPALLYLQFYVVAIDGTSNINVAIQYDYQFSLTFSGINNLLSTQP